MGFLSTRLRGNKEGKALREAFVQIHHILDHEKFQLELVHLVSRDDDDWYEMFGTNSYIKTSRCFSLALGEEAYPTISDSNLGQLRFQDGNDPMVEGIFAKLRI